MGPGGHELETPEFIDDNVGALLEPPAGTRIEQAAHGVEAALATARGRMVRLEGDDAHQLLEIVLVTRELDTAGMRLGAVEHALAFPVGLQLVKQQSVGLLRQDDAHRARFIIGRGSRRQVVRRAPPAVYHPLFAAGRAPPADLRRDVAALHVEAPRTREVARSPAAGQGGRTNPLSRQGGGGADDPPQIPGELKRRTRCVGIELDAVEMTVVGDVDGVMIVMLGRR